MKAFSRKAPTVYVRYVTWLILLLILFLNPLPRSQAFIQSVFNTTGTYTHLVESTGTYTLTAVSADSGKSSAGQLVEPLISEPDLVK